MASTSSSTEANSVYPTTTPTPGVVYSLSDATPTDTPGTQDIPLVVTVTDSTSTAVLSILRPPLFPTWSIPTSLQPTSYTIPNAHTNLNVGAIVGAMIGGLVLVIASVVAIFYCRLYRRSPHHSKKFKSEGWQDLESKSGAMATDKVVAQSATVWDTYSKYFRWNETRRTVVIFPPVNKLHDEDPFSDARALPRLHGAPGGDGVHDIEMKNNPCSSPEPAHSESQHS